MNTVELGDVIKDFDFETGIAAWLFTQIKSGNNIIRKSQKYLKYFPLPLTNGANINNY